MIVRVTRRLRKKRIDILGGGFGGVYTVIYFCDRDGHSVEFIALLDE